MGCCVYAVEEVFGTLTVIIVYCVVCLAAEIWGSGTVIVVSCEYAYLLVLYIRRRFKFYVLALYGIK
jgi:hypothetical protein